MHITNYMYIHSLFLWTISMCLQFVNLQTINLYISSYYMVIVAFYTHNFFFYWYVAYSRQYNNSLLIFEYVFLFNLCCHFSWKWMQQRTIQMKNVCLHMYLASKANLYSLKQHKIIQIMWSTAQRGSTLTFNKKSKKKER